MELARIESSGLQTLLFNGSPLAISRMQGHSFKRIISNDSDGSVPYVLSVVAVRVATMPTVPLVFSSTQRTPWVFPARYQVSPLLRTFVG